MFRIKSSQLLISVVIFMILVGCSKKPALDVNKAALVNVELGLSYLSLGQVARSKTKLIHALTLSPNLPEAHSAMAYFLEKGGEIEAANASHLRALQFAQNGSLYNNYATFLCRQGNFNEADDIFQNALKDKQYARTAEVYHNAGVCALKAGEIEKGKAYLKTAIRRDPTLQVSEDV